MLFAKPDLRKYNSGDYREVINDINSNIYNFFKVLRDRYDELYHMISCSLYSQEEHRNSITYSGDDTLLKAYYFYINIQQSFSNCLNNGWSTSIYKVNHVFKYLNSHQKLKKCSERLQRCYIGNEDALRFIERWDSPQTFFYCDPPYPNANQGHYSGYTQQDFVSLLEKLDSIQGSFILSCYDNNAVPKDWKKVEFETVTSSSNTAKGGHRDKRTECIWIREARCEPRPEIKKIYQKQLELKLFNNL